MKQLIVRLKRNYHIIALIFILAISFALNFYAISKYGTGNEYYAACIKSMTQSFHNFFFVSFDPSGMVSVDKPPLGLWIQAISVLIFGYHGWAMLLPQALAGTASCFVIYILTEKHFGRPAGLLSSLIFALTPVVVVASRNNTMDMQLVFVLLVSAWLLFRSIDSGKWRYLFLVALFIGLGFNIKMLQAYMILPAVALTYLLFAKEKLSKRFLAGIFSVAIMLAVSLAWVFVVEIYPSANRPYVDSTSSNSMLELVVGHNGAERLFGSGMGGGIGGVAQGGGFDKSIGERKNDGNVDGTYPSTKSGAVKMPGERPDGSQKDPRGGAVGAQPNQREGQGGGGMKSSEVGSASPLRLWNPNLYGQGSWLLLFALVSMLVCIKKWNRKKDVRQGAFVFWSLWLITMVVFFSFAGFFHRYYLCMMAPAIAVLSGIGITAMYNGFKNKKGYIRPAILLIAFLSNIALEVICVLRYAELMNWLLPVIVGSLAVGIILLIMHLIKPKRAILMISIIVLLISALAAPLYWSLTPVMNVPNSTLPYAGPELAENSFTLRQNFGGSQVESGQTQNASLQKYLVSHYNSGSFLVVSQRSSDVASFIINTGLPCYAYGGFLGSDNSLSVDRLKALVTQGKITYFLLSSRNGGTGSEITTYVKANATLVEASEYSTQNTNVGQMGGQSGTLYLFQS